MCRSPRLHYPYTAYMSEKFLYSAGQKNKAVFRLLYKSIISSTAFTHESGSFCMTSDFFFLLQQYSALVSGFFFVSKSFPWKNSPSQKMAILCFVIAISGFPGRTAQFFRYRKPFFQRAFLRITSARVSFDLMRCIFRRRCSGLRLSMPVTQQCRQALSVCQAQTGFSDRHGCKSAPRSVGFLPFL